MTETIVSKVAIWLAAALLLLGAAPAQQNSAVPEGQPSPGRESQSAPCQPPAAGATTPFDTCKYLTLRPGIRPPKAVHTVDPIYPEAARQAKLNGSVVLAVAVNEKGGIDDIKVVRSSDRMFEQNAIDAVKQWEFLPATKTGKSVAVQETVEMGFRLY